MNSTILLLLLLLQPILKPLDRKLARFTQLKKIQMVSWFYYVGMGPGINIHIATGTHPVQEV